MALRLELNATGECRFVVVVGDALDSSARRSKRFAKTSRGGKHIGVMIFRILAILIDQSPDSRRDCSSTCFW